ncbi:aminotransferase class I/II-fold pyridoxal phosphate-dependent enzyme [Ferviditalea candida]|uniref:Aminotransferase class I/II-fold pyridoxal phosphate-dependent enzyme n=1 Tax=Ferviditalea candida TaxID=3108399 RepID=A0ABU5ZIP8_9BACL|nr:aminotransferase class I/II-fold pyridoxal phosphate-dependent enzyme [Paenibacillaceae bacterium T2]
MDQSRAPLFEALLEHHRRRPVSFHVPGHKSAARQIWTDLDASAHSFFKDVLNIDLTEIAGLDDIHQPEGVIREAEQLAAQCFGAERTFFLVNGSTAGNLAMILAHCGPGDLLIVQRDVHKSVIHGLMLARARAVFVSPLIDERSGLAVGVEPAALKQALDAYPEAKGVLLVRPNYYGMAGDLKALVQLVHASGKPVFVDEAHGAHLGFHEEIPPSALTAGADVVVQSTHKMLRSMTMGSMLHVQGSLAKPGEIRKFLSILQTTSPSYPIMASLDLARRDMHMYGREQIEKGLEAVRLFAAGMSGLPWFELVSDKAGNQAGRIKDPFKVIVADRTGTFSGYSLQSELERRGCMAEMADLRHVLLVFSPFSTYGHAEKLLRAFNRISGDYKLQKKELQNQATNNIGTNLQLNVISSPVSFDAHNGSQPLSLHTVGLTEAEDAVSAEMVVPYPPGVPVLYPGERINGTHIRYLRKLSEAGARFHGVKDAKLQTIEVYFENS